MTFIRYCKRGHEVTTENGERMHREDGRIYYQCHQCHEISREKRKDRKREQDMINYRKKHPILPEPKPLKTHDYDLSDDDLQSYINECREEKPIACRYGHVLNHGDVLKNKRAEGGYIYRCRRCTALSHLSQRHRTHPEIKWKNDKIKRECQEWERQREVFRKHDREYCPHGHKRTPENTRWRINQRNGKRYPLCRLCENNHTAIYLHESGKHKTWTEDKEKEAAQWKKEVQDERSLSQLKRQRVY